MDAAKMDKEAIKELTPLEQIEDLIDEEFEELKRDFKELVRSSM